MKINRPWKKRFISLKSQNTIAVIIAFALAVSVFLVSYNAVDDYINDKYLLEENVQKRVENYIDKFRKFVETEDIKHTDYDEIESWCKDEQYVFMEIFLDNTLLFETDGNYLENYDKGITLEESEIPSDIYLVNFKDGVYGVYVIEFSENRIYSLQIIVCLALAFIVALAILSIYNHRNIKRITELSSLVDSLKNFDEDKEIKISGNDELTSLANDINQMRNYMISLHKSEVEALRNNKELLTALSHDVRTPLTSLMLYTNMLTSGDEIPKELAMEYANICHEKTLQLKDLTDQLFKYFYAFTYQNVEVHLEAFDCQTLLSQLLSEKIFYLKQKGFEINYTEKFDSEKEIETDVSLLNRVFDNVASNIEKYAQKDEPINISIDTCETEVKIVFSNTISSEGEKAASTGVGLKTCQSIMTRLQGSFQTELKGEEFYSVITIKM